MKRVTIEVQDNYKQSTDTPVFGAPKVVRVGKTEKVFEEIMAKNFPNLMKITNPHIQEFQYTPSTRNLKIITKEHHNKIAQNQQ
jgi:hypothetical protein